MKVFTAGLGTETNTFSELYIGPDDFRQAFLFGPGAHPAELTEVSAPLFVLREMRDRLGWNVVEGTYAFALPGGRVGRSTYEALRDRILGELRGALPVDFVALSMHGAMAAIGYDDCEGDFLRRAREIVGSRVAIGVEIDPHAHLSAEMVENADIVIAMKEYPHTDFLERGRELIDLLARTARGEIRPVQAVHDCRTIGRFHTLREPMQSFVRRLAAYETDVPGLLSVSFIHGFPWGDVPDMGAKMLVVADGDTALAQRSASELGREIEALRARTFTMPVSVDEGLAQAMQAPQGPIVIADVADNPGGGAGGDATVLLRALLARDVDACLGPLWDPIAVRFASSAGVGAEIALRIGGKSGRAAGDPLDIHARVLAVSSEAYQSWAGTRMSLGAACAIEIGHTQVVLTSSRDQAYSPDLFTNLGIDPRAKHIVAVKSAQHFLAGFGALARAVILVGGGGPLETDFRKIAYRHIRRPMWPLD